ncbi:ATP-binding protein [Edaphobacter aggregans]|uniref:ATP-binding protein n=1 Tax=Edaphobacter aggregans TaxID=570835 RepID=UPI001470171E|nr:ATP-binding protein [Edaphobacter aggregans]
MLENLKTLHLPAMRDCFEQAAQHAEKETLSYEQYLLELSERECESRRHNRIAALLRESGLPREKTMANFDLKRLPVKAGRQLKALVDGGFLDRKENLLLFGNPGAGKSHLLCALAHELIAQGRRMKYTSCALMVRIVSQESLYPDSRRPARNNPVLQQLAFAGKRKHTARQSRLQLRRVHEFD